MAQVLSGLKGAGARLVLRVAGECCSMPAEAVSEVVRGAGWTRVPNTPPSLLGLINLRGALLPVVSLAALLRGAEAAVPASARVVVLERSTARGQRVGVLVDEVATLGGGMDAAPLDLDLLLDRDFAPAVARRGGLWTGAGLSAPAVEGADAGAQAASRDVDLIGLRIAGQGYALRLSDVIEVLRLPSDWSHVAQADPAILGVIARPKGILPLVSLRELLGLPGDATRSSGRIVVAKLGATTFGLVVDAVNEILRVSPDAFDPVPPVLSRGRGDARIEAICRLDEGQRLVCLLAVAGLLDAETTARVLALAEGEATRMSDSTAATADATEQFVVFRLGGEEYGLPVAAVHEVVRRPANLTRIPHAPGFVAGVMNLRGRVVPVIEQRTRLLGTATEAGAAGRVLMVTTDGLQAGFAVDEVSEVLRLAATDLRPMPDLAGGASALVDRVALRPDGRMILLVEPRALLDQAERDLLSGLAEGGAPSPPA